MARPPIECKKRDVQCFCRKCKGALRPRATRDGHYAQQRRPTSTVQYLSSERKRLRMLAKDTTTVDSDPPVSTQAVREESVVGASQISVDETERAGHADSARAPPSNPTGSAALIWAFVSSLSPPSFQPLHALSSLSVRPLSSRPSLNDSLQAEHEDVLALEGEDVPPFVGVPEGLEGPDCEDDWENVDDNDDVSDPEGGQTDQREETTTGSRSTTQGPPSAHDDVADSNMPSTPNMLPLDPISMARIDEDDPFLTVPYVSDPHWTALSIAHPAVVLAMLLTAWLHLAAHLPFRFCNVLLSVIGFILAEAGHASLLPSLRTTLHSTLSALRLEPDFRIYPTCPSCLRPFPATGDENASCTSCGHPLFKPHCARPGRHSHKRRGRKPFLRTPAKSIADQLGDLLIQPGMEDSLTAWRRRSRVAGWLYDFFDGAISRLLLGVDGLPFFRHELEEDPNGELRIALALGVDWFSYLRSLIAPSYTSCPMSFNILNLPPSQRYRACNLLLSMIIPGPKETDPDQTQHYLKIVVSELLRLWRDGVVLRTHRYPQGRRVRVILAGVFCDKPAAHKIGGFGSHAHTFFCTRDWITQGLKATVRAFMPGAFIMRTNERHRDMMREYKSLDSKHARDEYAKAYATRWSELERLPYFDMCRMIVVDPMHNLFLGVVKTHFYHIWVQLKIFRKTKEIRRLHEILAKLTLPSKLGRLPRLIGEPAGGSLTADQWLILAMSVGPLALPELWEGLDVNKMDEDFLVKRLERIRQAAQRQKDKQKAKRKKAAKSRKSKPRSRKLATQADATAPRRSGRVPKPTEKARDMVLDDDDAGAVPEEEDGDWEDDNEDDEDELDPGMRTCQLHPRDLNNFFKLCRALRLFISDAMSEEQIASADALIREYCTELLELYGPEVIRPNHHYATHTGDFIRDFGPLRGFWTFLFERLNKVLKGYRTNNHEGGEIEVTFFREFHRATQLQHVLTSGLRQHNTTTIYQTCHLMHEATADNRGTLQQLAEELDQAHEDDTTVLAFSARSASERLDAHLYFKLVSYMQARYPSHTFHSELAVRPAIHSIQLINLAVVFDYVIIAGHRYYASTRSTSPENSIALVRTSDTGATWTGVIQSILHYEVNSAPRQLFAYVQWLRPATRDLTGSPWAMSQATFALQLWAHESFLDPATEPAPSPIVQLSDILAPVARHAVRLDGESYWITMPISRNPVIVS